MCYSDNFSAVPPVLASISADQIVTVGDNVTFTCTATGFHLMYLWDISPTICQNCILGNQTSELTIIGAPYFPTMVNVTCSVVDFRFQRRLASASLRIKGYKIKFSIDTRL